MNHRNYLMLAIGFMATGLYIAWCGRGLLFP